MALSFKRIVISSIGILIFVLGLEYLIQSKVDSAIDYKIDELKEIFRAP